MLRAAAPFLLSSVPLLAQVCQTQALAWPDPQQDARVGTSIARHADTLVAGGPYVDLSTGGGGAVYVWRLTNGVWNLEQKVAPAGLGFASVFGRAVAVHGDRLVAGGNPGLNAVWLFRRSGTQWHSAGQLPPSGYTYAINFGHAVAVDGELLAVGAPQANGAAPLTVRTGAVFLFRDQGGVVTEIGQLQPATLAGTDEFGNSLAMRGGVLAVGSAMGTQLPTTGSGAAFVYRLVNGQAVLEATLQSPAASPGRNSLGATFGQVVATDGLRVAVADVGETVAPFQTGAVHVWLHQGGAWVHEASVVARPNTCGFGSRLAIAGDELIVGQSCGHRVAHFRRIAGSWVEQGISVEQNGSSFQVSGLALEGQELGIGSVVNPGQPGNAGQVLTFRLGSGSMPYGSGLRGSGGVIPVLFGTGCPRVSQAYSMDLSGGLGGSFALLAIGFQPGQTALVGGTLWIGAVGSIGSMTLTGTAGQPGVGGFQFPLAVPSASYVGLRLYAQAGVLDPGAVQGFSLSNGLEVVIGN